MAVAPDATVTLTGAAATSAVGTLTATGQATTTLTGTFATASVGIITSTGIATVTLLGAQAVSAAGVLLGTGAGTRLLVGAAGTFSIGTITAVGSGAGGIIWPNPAQVLAGVQYGPTGAEYTGTYTDPIRFELDTGRLVKPIGSKLALLL